MTALLFVMRQPRRGGGLGGQGDRGGNGRWAGSEHTQQLLASPKLASSAAFEAAFVNSPSWGPARAISRAELAVATGASVGDSNFSSSSTSSASHLITGLHTPPPRRSSDVAGRGGTSGAGSGGEGYVPPELKAFVK